MEAPSRFSKPITMSSHSYPTVRYRHPYLLDNRFHTVMYTPYGYTSMPFAAEPNFVRFANPVTSSSYENYADPSGRAFMVSPYLTGK